MSADPSTGRQRRPCVTVPTAAVGRGLGRVGPGSAAGDLPSSYHSVVLPRHLWRQALHNHLHLAPSGAPRRRRHVLVARLTVPLGKEQGRVAGQREVTGPYQPHEGALSRRTPGGA